MSDDTPISHLQRRKIEGRVLIPFIEACRTEFGDDATKKVVTATIRGLAAKDGADWASAFGTDMSSLRRVAEELWAGGGSLVGFNTAIELERSQTIMQGAPCCDFRFRNKS